VDIKSNRQLMEILKREDLHLKKRWGQNFLTDDNIITKIVKVVSLDKDMIVIEIGVGSGTLTKKLATYFTKVLAYEIDKRLEGIIRKHLEGIKNIEIIYDDFLKRDLDKDLQRYKYKKIAVVANLPYYITTPIINKLIRYEGPIDLIVVTIQKEVAERFMALPNTKKYSSLSIYIDNYFEVNKLFDIKRESFMPKPEVDSVVIKLKRRDKKKVEVLDEDDFFHFVRKAFRFKRKNLRNNLSDYNLEKIENILDGFNMDLTARAEQLTIEQFATIYKGLK
jgi:16S rRNA (adenine1518-N6/adenine1519-N6)-dimethyltransferase